MTAKNLCLILLFSNLSVFLILFIVGSNLINNSLMNDLSIYDKVDWWNAKSSLAILARMNAVRVPYFVEYFPANATRIGDIGCGGGFVSEAIAKTNDKFLLKSIDISKNSIDQAQAHALLLPSSVASRINYQQGSIYELPFAENSLDVVIVSDVFEHLHELQKALQELNRVLKHGHLK